MNLRYPDKVTIVTGGSRGIGAGCVRVFADAGANVAFCSPDEAEGRQLEAEVNRRGRGQSTFTRCDIIKTEELQGFITQTVTQYGRLDCLINNAGWHPPHKPIDDFSLDEFRDLLELNLISMFAACKFSLPYLRQTRGNIINMGSLVGSIGQAGAVTYVATKGAVIAFSKALAIDEAVYGVRVNSVSPGAIDTPLIQDTFDASEHPQQARVNAETAQLLGRLGTIEEAGRLCLFIAAEATFTTGVDHILSGGYELGYDRKSAGVGQNTSPINSARFAYVGAYTRSAPGGWSDAAEAEPPMGISVFAISQSGEWDLIQTVPSENPSWLTLHPDQRALYVSNEIGDYEGRQDGSIESYAIDDETGKLTLLNRVSSHGALPAHLTVDPAGTSLIVANYIGGNFAAFHLMRDGSLGAVIGIVQNEGSGPNPERQEAPHPHSVLFAPTGSFIATADLGADQIKILVLDDNGLRVVSESKTAPGSGPRHVAFHPNGHFLYVVNELAATVTVFPFDPGTGALGMEIQTVSTLPDDFLGEKSAAEIMVHPSGHSLYVSNRKYSDHPLADSIAAFQIDVVTGRLTLIGHTTAGVDFPRAFIFDPSGQWFFVLNQKSDSIIPFIIDLETVELKPAGGGINAKVPVCLAFKELGGEYIA